MDKIFLVILNLSLTASFVIAVVLVARLILRRAPKVISYALWAVVLLNLIVPFKPVSPLSLIPFRSEPIPSEYVIVPGQDLNILEAGYYSLSRPLNDFVISTHPDTVDIGDPQYEKVSNGGEYTATIFGYIAWFIFGSQLWLIGAAIMLIKSMVSYIRLKRSVSLAVRVDGNIYETDTIDSPFVLGLLRPRIYIPKGIDPAMSEFIIKHERAHIRRRDYIISVLAYIVLAFHWFNPLVWVAYMLMQRDMESSCDEAVLRDSNEDIRRGYSAALLSFSVHKKQLSFPIAFGEQSVKERVKNVMNFRKPSHVIIAAAIVLVVVLSIGLSLSRPSGIIPEKDAPAVPIPSVMTPAATSEPILDATNAPNASNASNALRAPMSPEEYSALQTELSPDKVRVLYERYLAMLNEDTMAEQYQLQRPEIVITTHEAAGSEDQTILHKLQAAEREQLALQNRQDERNNMIAGTFLTTMCDFDGDGTQETVVFRYDSSGANVISVEISGGSIEFTELIDMEGYAFLEQKTTSVDLDGVRGEELVIVAYNGANGGYGGFSLTVLTYDGVSVKQLHAGNLCGFSATGRLLPGFMAEITVVETGSTFIYNLWDNHPVEENNYFIDMGHYNESGDLLADSGVNIDSICYAIVRPESRIVEIGQYLWEISHPAGEHFLISELSFSAEGYAVISQRIEQYDYARQFME